MNLEQYILSYNQLSVKEMTEIFNSFEVEERLEFLETLSDSNKEEFVRSIRQQAVDNFWFHEREAILNGESTRNWTPEQMEYILNISEVNGNMYVNAGKAIQVDSSEMPITDAIGNKLYYSCHRGKVSVWPEFAGEWRYIQALDFDEMYFVLFK